MMGLKHPHTLYHKMDKFDQWMVEVLYAGVAVLFVICGCLLFAVVLVKPWTRINHEVQDTDTENRSIENTSTRNDIQTSVNTLSMRSKWKLSSVDV
mmetsp:Transcript_8165/g.14795  ORF Transcript_8165/g.14795 Transcript_8165/m.14795 type:complete len:96 (-) Transcript_8165:1695-1982(-)